MKENTKFFSVDGYIGRLQYFKLITIAALINIGLGLLISYIISATYGLGLGPDDFGVLGKASDAEIHLRMAAPVLPVIFGALAVIIAMFFQTRRRVADIIRTMDKTLMITFVIYLLIPLGIGQLILLALLFIPGEAYFQKFPDKNTDFFKKLSGYFQN